MACQALPTPRKMISPHLSANLLRPSWSAHWRDSASHFWLGMASAITSCPPRCPIGLISMLSKRSVQNASSASMPVDRCARITHPAISSFLTRSLITPRSAFVHSSATGWLPMSVLQIPFVRTYRLRWKLQFRRPALRSTAVALLSSSRGRVFQPRPSPTLSAPGACPSWA